MQVNTFGKHFRSDKKAVFILLVGGSVIEVGDDLIPDSDTRAPGKADDLARKVLFKFLFEVFRGLS
ncbi:MAG: hypothetical protein DDT31_01941 [Syntrophomonadaceae bacterium]|nr:hypothetical protein [Bacillota bacterium]